MTIIYDYHKREQTPSWLLAHINTLLREAISNNNSSFILYAAFEIRNLIEKISFDIIYMSTSGTERAKIESIAKGKQGIRRSNSEYKALKYRYQTFSEAIAKVAGLPIKAFDYKKAETFETELGEYVHSYTRNQEDFNFSSEFIQNGVLKIKEAVKFIEEYFVKINGDGVFGVLNFSTLTGEYRTEFETWKCSVDTDCDALYERLRVIHERDPLILKNK